MAFSSGCNLLNKNEIPEEILHQIYSHSLLYLKIPPSTKKIYVETTTQNIISGVDIYSGNNKGSNTFQAYEWGSIIDTTTFIETLHATFDITDIQVLEESIFSMNIEDLFKKVESERSIIYIFSKLYKSYSADEYFFAIEVFCGKRCSTGATYHFKLKNGKIIELKSINHSIS